MAVESAPDPSGSEAGVSEESGAHHEVINALRERIVGGELPPGARLVERTLAQELGVSRIPVREALNVLRGEGFVTAYPRRGMVVRALSDEDIEELFEVREALEVLVARCAAARATDAELDRLANVLEAEAAAEPLPRGETDGRYNQRFHDLLTAYAHNSFLASLMEPIEGRIHWLFRRSGQNEFFRQEHRAILDALRSRDADRAGAAALAHVHSSHEVWRKSSRGFPATLHGSSH